MVLNYIWIGFIIIAFVIALVKLIILGDVTVFPALIDSTFASSKTAFEISLGLTAAGWSTCWPGRCPRCSPGFSPTFPRVTL